MITGYGLGGSPVFQLLVGAEEEGAQRRGRDGCRIMFPKVVFLGAPENSLGEKASEIFANIQRGDKISQVLPSGCSQPGGKCSRKL